MLGELVQQCLQFFCAPQVPIFQAVPYPFRLS
jgi:hypothetical protein